MKNIKQKKCKNCKGTGFIPLGEGIKGLKECPVCKGTGLGRCGRHTEYRVIIEEVKDD